MHGFCLLFNPGRKHWTRGISKSSQTERQTGGVGICVRFETGGEKVRSAAMEISQTQTDDRLWVRLERHC